MRDSHEEMRPARTLNRADAKRAANRLAGFPPKRIKPTLTGWGPPTLDRELVEGAFRPKS